MEYVLKIGGSVLTDKETERKLSEDFSDILETVAEHPQGVIVHGAGSFGHPPAERHGLASGSREGIMETHSAVSDLNSLVVEELRENSVDAIPVHPLSASYRDSDTHMMTEQVLWMEREGCTPVLHGDGVVTEGKGFTVISGDEIVPMIEKEAGTGEVGFCTSAPGVLDEDGEVVDEIDSLDEFHERDTEGIDVSGGMRNKLEKIFEYGIDARIFGKEDLKDFLEGEEVGTLVRGR
jgi:isopentenyl phosphate kinase